MTDKPDRGIQNELATIRMRLACRRAGSMKLRIAQAIRDEEAESGRALPDHLSPADLLERLRPHLERRGYKRGELPTRRHIHYFRTGK